MKVPIGALERLGKAEGWGSVLGKMESPGSAFVPGPVTNRMATRAAPLSSRGFAGTSYRNPLMPEFADAGPGVMESAYKARPQRMRKIVVEKPDAEDAAAAIRGDHIDNSRLGKLRRLLLETKGGPLVLAGLGGAGLGAAMSGGEDEQQIDPRMMAMYGGY